MGPVAYRVRSVLRAHPARAVAMASVVAVVGAVVLTLGAGVSRTLSTSSRYVESRGSSGHEVAVEQQRGRPRTAEIAALPAVARVDTATFVFGGLVGGDGELIEGFVFSGSPGAFGARISKGRAPDPAVPSEFAATRAWLAATGADVGDTFRLVTITQDDADRLGFDAQETDGPSFDATLVGVLDAPSELQDPTPLAVFGSELLDLGDVGVAATVGVVGLELGATVEQLRTQLDSLPAGGDFGLEPRELVPAEVRAAVRAEGHGLGIVALVVAIAAVAVLGQLLSRQVRAASSQRVALRAIGFTRAQVVADPASFALLTVIAGCVVAGVIAYAASGIFPTGFARRVEPQTGLRFEPLVHLGGPLVLAVLVVSWVSLTLRLGERARPAPQHPGVARSAASRLPPGPLALGARFAFIRHPRDPGSVRAPLIALVLIQVIVVGALTFGASVDRVLEEPARYGSNFDFATGAGGDEVPEEMQALLVRDPDVSDVTLYGTLLASVGTTALDVTGMQPLRGRLEPDVVSGRIASEADEIVLGRVAARELGVGVDDEVVITGATGPVPFRVTGLAVIPSIEGGDGIGEGAVVTFDGLRRLDPDAALAVAAVRLRPGAGDALSRISSEVGVRLGLPDRPSAVLNLERTRSTPFVVAGALASLAVLSLSHQVIAATRRRRRDLAMVRALGAQRWWVSAALHWQVMLLSVLVSVVAVPLGVAAGRIVHHAYIDRIGARTDISVPFLTLASVVGGLLVLGNAAAMIAGRRVRREPPARALAGE